MDFTGRGSQPAQPASTPQYNAAPAAGNSKKTTKLSAKRDYKRWGTGLLGLLLLALVVSLIVFVAFGGQKKESAYIDDSRMQAVFLQTGQVYFGKIKNLNAKYIELENIYYLQTSSTGTTSTAANANTNVSLVKLGCELHAPFDRMLINRDQVTFWENLQDSGQVAKAVATFEKDNPNGQKCSDQSAAPNSSTSVQGSSTTGTSTGTTSDTNTGN